VDYRSRCDAIGVGYLSQRGVARRSIAISSVKERSMLQRPQHRTKQEMAYQALRTSIMRCELQPGDRLIIDDISRQLGVSHIPVREALHQLQSDGLVINVPHAGATVALISPNDVSEVFSLMEGLERIALRVAAAKITPAELQELSQAVEAMDQAVAADDGEEWANRNSDFHRHIAHIADMTLLIDFTERTLDQWERVRRYYNILSGRMTRAQQQHHEILEALETVDIEQLEYLATIHNREARDAYLAQNDAVNR
jgi:DNA-binding GntR family transcriptional regulator